MGHQIEPVEGKTREELCVKYCEGLTDEWLAYYWTVGCNGKWVWNELQQLRYGNDAERV